LFPAMGSDTRERLDLSAAVTFFSTTVRKQTVAPSS
jgi:hypothetical protein